jgi:hypothetical protein
MQTEKVLMTWIIITRLFSGFRLLAHGLSVFGGELFLGRNWEERKIQEILNEK